MHIILKQFPLKLLHPRNPPDRETHFPRYLTVQIQVEILNLYWGIWVSRCRGFRHIQWNQSYGCKHTHSSYVYVCGHIVMWLCTWTRCHVCRYVDTHSSFSGISHMYEDTRIRHMCMYVNTLSCVYVCGHIALCRPRTKNSHSKHHKLLVLRSVSIVTVPHVRQSRLYLHYWHNRSVGLPYHIVNRFKTVLDKVLMFSMGWNLQVGICTAGKFQGILLHTKRISSAKSAVNAFLCGVCLWTHRQMCMYVYILPYGICVCMRTHAAFSVESVICMWTHTWMCHL